MTTIEIIRATQARTMAMAQIDRTNYSLNELLHTPLYEAATANPELLKAIGHMRAALARAHDDLFRAHTEMTDEACAPSPDPFLPACATCGRTTITARDHDGRHYCDTECRRAYAATA